ncbi:PqiC family protein [Litchfieldella xinjiangensis]|uniref:PqiC family protein n=1 Tax=Litchfieldella xinjiangensis TaxID=1166948 RepID=UPI0009DE200F|nr:ABC-type transport auxiliary lipoprotein family protein [Halomonas xinjiangensis]
MTVYRKTSSWNDARRGPRAWRWIAAIMLAALWLGGCASSGSSTQRYTLPTVDATSRIMPNEVEHTLVVRPIRLANYLDSEGIVLQLDDITLNRAGGHLWAESLGRQLTRGLRQRLTTRLGDTRVLSDDASRDAMTLTLEVEQFQGHYEGTARAAGTWQLRDAQGSLLTQEPFHAETTLAADGYPALVRALGESWNKVADRLAERIVELR